MIFIFFPDKFGCIFDKIIGNFLGINCVFKSVNSINFAKFLKKITEFSILENWKKYKNKKYPDDNVQ